MNKRKQCVIVPYRDREENLKQFKLAIQEKLPLADIYIVEQEGNGLFNKGKLINCGFILSNSKYEYYMFHDVDLIPVYAEYNHYPINPTHIATSLSQFDYKMPYQNYFGGCVLFTENQYKCINGFSNRFEGWGCEDDDFYNSFINKGIKVDRKQGIFKSLPHPKAHNNNTFAKNYELLSMQRNYSEGLSTTNFRVVDFKIENNFYHFLVSI